MNKHFRSAGVDFCFMKTKVKLQYWSAEPDFFSLIRCIPICGLTLILESLLPS